MYGSTWRESFNAVERLLSSVPEDLSYPLVFGLRLRLRVLAHLASMLIMRLHLLGSIRAY